MRRKRLKRRARIRKLLICGAVALVCCAGLLSGWRLLNVFKHMQLPPPIWGARAQTADLPADKGDDSDNLELETQPPGHTQTPESTDAALPSASPTGQLDDGGAAEIFTPEPTPTQMDESGEVYPANPAKIDAAPDDAETASIPKAVSIPENAEELVDDPGTEEGRLSGIRIGIDPGHQAKGDSGLEPIAPGSSEKKAKVSSGTAGVKTRVAEHVVNLEIALKLRDALEAEGAEVFMTRETADVNISNIERATMMNDLGVDLVLRIHCNGSTNKSARGIGLYVRKTGTNAEECLKAAQALMPAMIAATDAREDGIFERDTYTGLNWSEVPSILVEMGFMSNAEEDVLLNTPEYQGKLVSGMVEGIAAYCLNDDMPSEDMPPEDM